MSEMCIVHTTQSGEPRLSKELPRVISEEARVINRTRYRHEHLGEIGTAQNEQKQLTKTEKEFESDGFAKQREIVITATEIGDRTQET